MIQVEFIQAGMLALQQGSWTFNGRAVTDIEDIVGRGLTQGERAVVWIEDLVLTVLRGNELVFTIIGYDTLTGEREEVGNLSFDDTYAILVVALLGDEGAAKLRSAAEKTVGGWSPNVRPIL